MRGILNRKRSRTRQAKKEIHAERFKPLFHFLKGKRVYLCLSGGGLALVCHIAAVRFLEEHEIKVERVYGTSAGAVIGGFYSAGLTSEQMREAVLHLRNPDDLFGIASRQLVLRALLGEVQARFIRGGFKTPGIFNAKKLEKFIEKTILSLFGTIPLLGELKKDFSAVAFNIGSGKKSDRGVSAKQVFSTTRTPHVSLKDAIMASISIPGIFPPKKVGDYYYIDGGVVENLPIVSAYEDWLKKRRLFERNLALIAVDLGYGGETLVETRDIKPHDMIIYGMGVQGKTINQYNLLRIHNPRRGIHVVLVRPRCSDIGLTDFEKIEGAIESSYDSLVRQLEGQEFLKETTESLQKARIMLGISEE